MSNNIVLNLKIIAQTKEKEKLTLKENYFEIDKYSVLQGIKRWLSSSNRAETIKSIELIYNHAFTMSKDLLDKIKNNDDDNNDFEDNPTQVFQQLYFDLKASIKGLENLKITYKNDVSIVSRLEILISNVNNHIKNIENMLKIKVD